MAEDNTPQDNDDIDVQEPDDGIAHGNIEQVDLQLEMQRSYLDYAMSVIVGRALPDVRDGQTGSPPRYLCNV